MALLGKRNQLSVLRETASGLYLDGGNLGEILLPGKYIPEGTQEGDRLEVFLYRDSEDRLVATTEVPKAMVGEFALLKVIGFRRNIGAFLDWGLSKDLLLPLGEQEKRVEPGDRVVAYVFVDPTTQRIVASTRLGRFLGKTPANYRHNQAVRLMVAGETSLGFSVIVDGAHRGLLYKNALSVPVSVGDQLQGYVRTVREDGKIDVALTPTGYKRINPLARQILERLEANGGRLELDDKSSPEAIMEAFSTSKKAFKQALGTLFKERRVAFENGGTKLLPKGRWED